MHLYVQQWNANDHTMKLTFVPVRQLAAFAKFPSDLAASVRSRSSRFAQIAPATVLLSPFPSGIGMIADMRAASMRLKVQ